MKSAAITLGDAPSTSRCSECDERMMEVTRLQNEINDAKDQVRRLLDDIGDLSGKLDEEEAVAFEKDEAIKSLQLALNVETEARNALDSDLRAKEEECLSLLNSLETLSTSAKEKSEEHRLEMEQMRAELSENTEELKKSQEMISQLSKARTAAEEITISLQETASSLSEQLNQAITERENAIAGKEKAEALSEEWKAKHVELKMELDNVVINNEATRKMEVDRLTVENEHLTDKLHNLETEHERAVADLTAMQESHNQFVEVLTKKVDHFKEEKAEWLLERESMTAEIASLKEEAEARKEVESEKSTLESYVENLTKEVSELSIKEKEQKESVNRLTSQLEELGKEKDKLSGERESLLHDLASFQSKLSAQSELFEQQKIASDSRIEELTKEAADCTRRENEQKELVNRLNIQLEERAKEKEKYLEERESFLNDLASFQSKLSAQSESLEQQKNTSDSRIGELTKEVAEFTLRENEQRELVHRLTAQLEEREFEKDELLEERESLLVDLASFKNKLSAQNDLLEQQKSMSVNRIEELTKENAQLSKQLRDALQSAEELKKKVTTLEATTVLQEELRSSNEKHIKEMEAELRESYESERKAREEQCHQIEEDFTKAIEKVHTLTEEKAKSESLLERLRQEVADKHNQLVSLRIDEANVTALHRDAMKRIELLEKQLKEQKAAAEKVEIKVQKAVQIDERTLSEETDYVANVSTPSSNHRINSSSDEDDGFDYDDTYDDDELKAEHSAPVSPKPEPVVNGREEYCEFCSDYGHDTFSCASYLMRRQGQNQTRHK
ncbi:unnamed protein product [Haemonchus placei]|uniref:CLIP1_ZNF domain-containing protein n=1 Tax=Haemonchus placei TaxID=6290 RepID=A0A158QMT6_HAEPC|nr:unnamed protein product [Haemonchus placei]